MLVESIDIMRGLWEGELFSHRGEHYVVENARLYRFFRDELHPALSRLTERQPVAAGS